MLTSVCLLCTVLLLHTNEATNSTLTEADAEDNFCLADKPNITLGKDYVGEMYVYEHSCDMPTQIQNHSNSGEGIHYFPARSQVRILCDTLTDRCCKNGSTYLGLNEDGLPVTTKFLNYHQTLFTMNFLTTEHEGFLVCHCNKSENDEGCSKSGNALVYMFKPIIRFFVGEKPAPAQGFSCTAWNFRYANCSWTNQKSRNVIWRVCYKRRDEDNSSMKCEAPTSVTKFKIEDYKYLSEYTIHLSGKNHFGVTNTTFNYTLTNERLHAPNMTVTEPIGSTAVIVQWKQQCDSEMMFREFCLSYGLLYKVTLSIDEKITPDIAYINETDRIIIVNGVFQPTNETMQTNVDIVVQGLLPATNYIIQMEQKINGTGNWSLTANDTFQTAEQIADRGPVVQPNGFSEAEGACDVAEHRKVTVYWKRMQVHNGGNGIATKYSIFETMKPAVFRQMTVCVEKEATELPIYVHNHEGKGRSPSTLTIPQQTHVIDLASCLVKAHRDKRERNSVFVDWRFMSEHLQLNHESVDVTYTIFWCKFTDSTCQEELGWHEVSTATNQTKQRLTMHHDPSFYRYGIAAQFGEYRSGVVWADCLLGPAITDNIGLEYSVTTYNRTHAKVVIEPKCINEIGMIESIELYYCQQQDSKCKSKKSSASFCGKVSYVQLDPATGYNLWLDVFYSENTVVKKYKRTNFTLTYNTGVERNITVILLIAMAAVMSAIIAAIACYARRKCRRMQKLRIATIKPILLAEDHLTFNDKDNSTPYECWNMQTDNSDAVELLLAAPASLLNEDRLATQRSSKNIEVVKCTMHAQTTSIDASVNPNFLSQRLENHDSDYCTDVSGDSALGHQSSQYDQSAIESFNRKLEDTDMPSQTQGKQLLNSGYVRVDPQPVLNSSESGSLSSLHSLDLPFSSS